MGANRNSKLVLHKETIKRLTGAELKKVAGGGPPQFGDEWDTSSDGCTGTCSCISVCISCFPGGQGDLCA